jgi:hypothetical protein
VAAVPAWLAASWLEASAGDVARAASDLAQAGELADALDDQAADLLRHRAFPAIQLDELRRPAPTPRRPRRRRRDARARHRGGRRGG